MGWGVIIIIILVIGAIYLIQTDKVPSLDFTKLTQPIKDIQDLTFKNETPKSEITKIDDKTYFSKPWQYYDCSTNEDCRAVFGVNTFCEKNQSSQFFGQCFRY